MQNEITIEQAIVMINELNFPHAVIGDTVKQLGFWFILTENGWVEYNKS